MRSDMFKVIVERPRPQSKNKYRGVRAKANKEDYVGKVGVTRVVTNAIGWDRKEFNENLNPLKKFLFSRVGQKWDDVYSEICQHINPNSTVQHHVLQHLWDYVEVDLRYQKDTSYPWKSRANLPIEEKVRYFYVDEKGLLRQSRSENYRSYRKRHRQQEQAKKDRKYRHVNGVSIVNVNGIWYFAEEKIVQKEDTFYRTYKDHKGKVQKYSYYETSVHDLVFPDRRLSIGDRYVATKGKQLSSKELATFGVSNGIEA